MSIVRLSALCALLLSLSLKAVNYADSVTSYNPGTGYASGFTNATAALGEPSRVTPGQFGGPVDPFDPPYLPQQITSVGAGGSLTVHFSAPVQNSASNPFGLDFLIFGNSGFVITNGDFSGGGITDGTLFGANAGATRVSVSADNITYYTLTPSLAPTVDAFYPTDGSGNFTQPVNPSLRGDDFSGKNLSAIRSLYAGSGGGSGFDISWAQDALGHPVNLASISFVRVDVLSGASEIDGFAAVPEPRIWSLGVAGGILSLGFLRSRSFFRADFR